MYIVYALHSHRYNKIYIGYTSDLHSRLKSHNELSKKGWVVKYRPLELAYTERFIIKSEAIRHERALQTARGRIFIWELIQSSK